MLSLVEIGQEIVRRKAFRGRELKCDTMLVEKCRMVRNSIIIEVLQKTALRKSAKKNFTNFTKILFLTSLKVLKLYNSCIDGGFIYLQEPRPKGKTSQDES